MTINNKTLKILAEIAARAATQETIEELHTLTQQGKEVYTEATLAAEIAVKLLMRVIGVPILNQGRELSPVDALVDVAEQSFRDNYAG